MPFSITFQPKQANKKPRMCPSHHFLVPLCPSDLPAPLGIHSQNHVLDKNTWPLQIWIQEMPPHSYVISGQLWTGSRAVVTQSWLHVLTSARACGVSVCMWCVCVSLCACVCMWCVCVCDVWCVICTVGFVAYSWMCCCCERDGFIKIEIGTVTLCCLCATKCYCWSLICSPSINIS